MPLAIGLTGGIASGKTAVADRFSELGVTIIDTDIIARQVVEPGTEGLRQVIKAFGESVLNKAGRLDRSRMRTLVFEDADRRVELESILHPLIRTGMWEQFDAARSRYAILVVPLLIETGLFRQMDRVLVVDVDEATQRQRLMDRDVITAAQADAILASQCSRQRRLEFADDVIDNSGDLRSLGPKVERQHKAYLALCDS